MRRRHHKSTTFWLMRLLIVATGFSIVIFIKQLLPEKTVVVGELSVTEQFIQEIGPKAQLIARQNDLYASVMIAQAILESDSGRSRLSQSPYFNFFGIKGDFHGQSVSFETWEDDGQGNPYTIVADFRSYGSVTNGLSDYASILRQNLYRLTHRSQSRSYRDATAALTGTYATDTTYGQKLNDLIQRYHLTRYDKTIFIN